jgi:hypothetical protein
VTIVVLLPPRFRDPMVGWTAVVSVSLTGFLTLGFFLGLAASEEVFGGKSHGLFVHFAPVVLFGMLSAYLLEDTVMLPKFQRFVSAETRLRFMGGYYIIAGLLIQIYAAFYDLWT